MAPGHRCQSRDYSAAGTTGLGAARALRERAKDFIDGAMALGKPAPAHVGVRATFKGTPGPTRAAASASRTLFETAIFAALLLAESTRSGYSDALEAWQAARP